MGNYDSGHYFLTVLAPIRMDSVLRDGQSHSRRHLIREALARFATGENTVVSRGTNPDPPFARSKATHFARFAVLDDVPYNGKVSGDSLLATALGPALKFLPKFLQPRPAAVDQLATPYLIFAADFDAASGAATELASYLEALWEDMRPELTSVFQHCTGFESVLTAQGFFEYVKSCQIETTMPFNDYWAPAPALRDVSLAAYLYPGGAFAMVLVAALVWGLVRPGYRPEFVAVLALFALLGVVALAIRYILAAAAKPFPPSPVLEANLPNVLKALYLQRAFVAFAIGNQGQSDAELYAAFGTFLSTHRPDDISPTQKAGVIGT